MSWLKNALEWQANLISRLFCKRLCLNKSSFRPVLHTTASYLACSTNSYFVNSTNFFLCVGVNLHQHFTCAFFVQKCFTHAAFLQLQFGFVIFWLQNITAKVVCKMLIKLIIVFSTTFSQVFWRSLPHFNALKCVFTFFVQYKSLLHF